MLSSHCPKSKEIERTEFMSLNVVSRSIKIIDKLSPPYYFISELYLDHNLLITLNGIHQFQNLQVLSFNFNQISIFNDLSKVNNKFFIKRLSFIGNPIQSHINAKVQYLTSYLFPNLQVLNPLQMYPSFEKEAIQRNKKAFNSYYTESEQQKTERFRRSSPQSLKTKRNGMKTEHTDRCYKQAKQNWVQVLSRKGSNRLEKQDLGKTVMNISTTINKSHEKTDQVYSHRNEARQKERNTNIKIKPFQAESYQQQKKQISGYIQEQSSINGRREKQQTISLFNETGYFDYENDNQTSNQRTHRLSEDGKNVYRNFALSFLEEQKQQIASAFYYRSIKQKVFYFLSSMKQNRIRQVQQHKRKALGSIKIYSGLERVFQGRNLT